jgi:hypothetical protein
VDPGETLALKAQGVEFCSASTQNLLLSNTLDRTISGLSQHDATRLSSSGSIFRSNNSMEYMVDFRHRVITDGFKDATAESFAYLDTPDLIRTDCYKEAVDKLSTHLLSTDESSLNDFIAKTLETEALMLVVVETGLCGILGAALLLKLIVPLHQSGAFITLVHSVKSILTFSLSLKCFIFKVLPKAKDCFENCL